MAHHKSALKSIRQDEKRTLRNRAYRTQTRHAIKKVRMAIKDGNLDNAKLAYTALVPALDHMAAKRILHPNNAARMKSRLNRQILLMAKSAQ
jgi:small subunit ribosomal protein S20